VTTCPANITQLRERRARPCRLVVLSRNTRLGRKPRRAHTHGINRGKTLRAAHTSCVTGSLLSRLEGLEAAFTPHPLISSTPRPSTSNPQKTPSQTPPEDPQEPSPQGPWSQSQRRTVEASHTDARFKSGEVADSVRERVWVGARVPRGVCHMWCWGDMG